jgi:hypothetical protein
MARDLVGRAVKVRGQEGIVVEWEPLGAGMTDALVEHENGKRVWYASHEFRPIDGKGSLPTRETARREADALAAKQLRSIKEGFIREIERHEPWPGMEFGKGMLGKALNEAIEEVDKRRKR